MTISTPGILEPLLIFGLCLCLADLGLAQKTGRRGGKRPAAAQIFKKLDKNGDGRLTKDELTGRGARLLKADANGDGAVTLAEPQRQEPPGERPQG